jgi:hypothetical protein
MKTKAAATTKPHSAVEEMLAKRESFVSERDALLSQLMELNASIESLDSVISMFDPKHIPIEIRRTQSAPLLTYTSQPILSEVAETVAVSEKKKATKEKAPASLATQTAPEAKSTERKIGRPAKTATKETAPDVAKAAETEAPRTDAVAAAAKAKKKQKSAKALDAAREKVREYMGDIDKLKTLEDIVASDPEGVPFRSVCDQFAKKHPIDISKPEMKKVFSDRLSALLFSLSQQNVVQRGERQGAEGKENVWLYIRSRGKAPDATVAA